MILTKTEKKHRDCFGNPLIIAHTFREWLFLLHFESKLCAMACLQRLLTQQLSVFSLLYRLLAHQKEFLAAPCLPADVLFRHYGTLHIHVERRQYLCPTVAYHNDAQFAMGRLHPLPHR